jgi:hypothetical protein
MFLGVTPKPLREAPPYSCRPVCSGRKLQNAMPFVPVPGTALVESVYQQDGQIIENTMYFTHSGTPTLAELTALADAVNSAIRTSILPLLSTTIQLIRVVATMLDVLDGLTTISTVSLPAGGADSSAPIPSDVAFVVSMRTGHRGRSFRGRNYIPGLNRDALGSSVNEATTAYINALLAAYTNIQGAGVDGGWVMSVVSRFSGFTIVGGRKVPTPRTVGISTPITNFVSVDNVVDSQRRRLPGRGR